MLPPINIGDDKMRIDDREPPTHAAKAANAHPAPHHPYRSAPPAAYAPYTGMSPLEDAHGRDAGTRGEQGQSLEGPLPSLRSVTGIGEALDTTRPVLPPPSSYAPTLTAPPPPPASATPSFTPLHTSQSPNSLHNREASQFERRPYERDASSYPPQFATHATQQQAASAPASLPAATGGSHTHSTYSATPQPMANTPHWRSSHASPTEASHAYSPAEGPASYAHHPPPERQDGVYRTEHHAGHAVLRPEDAQHAPGAVHGRSYGDSVKRHLDHFDLENAFNEIADLSRSLWDFSQHFRNKAHQTQRSGPLPGSTPNLKEIEDMASQTSRIQASLASLQEVVLSQQAALAERHPKESWKVNGTMPMDEASAAPGPAVAASSSSMAATAAAAASSPARDGFAGPDAKKKRGRAAPPGRCHSCNRAETPEWRRGPDGARTLCNACGLHYAKLTRKMGSNKAPAMSGSNLKPRTMSDALPPP